MNYAIGLTDIDPIKYGLIFDRFLNLERYTPPDIDVDFMDNRRDAEPRWSSSRSCRPSRSYDHQGFNVGQIALIDVVLVGDNRARID